MPASAKPHPNRSRRVCPPSQRGKVLCHRPLRLSGSLHRHDELEFILLAAGAMRYLAGGRQYTLQKHDLIWLFPEQDHGAAATTPDAVMYVAVFTPGLVRQSCRGQVAAPLRRRRASFDQCRTLTPADAGDLEQVLELTLAEQANPDFHAAALGYLLQRAWLAFEQAAVHAAAPLHPAVDAAVRALRRAEGRLSMSQVARAAALSYSRLSRLFHAQVGMTMVQFAHEQKLARFLRLREADSSLSLKTAAPAAGFASYAQFHRVFRRRMGCSPRAYRQGPR